MNFNYFIDDDTFRYLLDAVHLVARRGHHLLRERFRADSGLWRHRLGQGRAAAEPPRRVVRLGGDGYPRHPRPAPRSTSTTGGQRLLAGPRRTAEPLP